MTRISVRLDDELKEEFEQYCNHNGKSMSGVIKEDIRDRIGTSNTGPLPAEPELAKAYRHIHDIQSDDGRVPVSDAEPALANILNLPSKTVRRRILTQLDNRGYINVNVGIITPNVDLREQQPAASETAATNRAEVPADD